MTGPAILDIDAQLGALATDANVKLMLDALLRASEADMARLNAAIAADDVGEAGKAAHALAGGAMAAGAAALANTAREFELAAKAGKMPDAGPLQAVHAATREAALQRMAA